MAWRHALDSEPALIVATTLHTLGAIGVVAALVTHIAWYRKLRLGVDSKALDRATFYLTINAIFANLVGGFMRTYLPGHPTLADWSGSAWVQIVAVKHAFIFASLGALLYLHHRVAPRLRNLAWTEKLPDLTPAGHAIGSWVVVTGVVGASILGAMAQIAPLGEDFEDHGGMDAPPVTVIFGADGREVRYQNFTGTLTSLPPLLASTGTGGFSVAADIIQLTATLIYSDPAASLDFCIDAAASEGNAGGCSSDTLTVDAPALGDWTFTVSGSNAVNVAWELSVRTATVASDETLLAETLTVAPGAFFEINTQMPLGGTFAWDWTTTADVHFDVHSHFDGEVQYLVEYTASEGQGNFTNEREGGYSLLWANEGNTPISLSYRVWGEFEVDSYFPPR